jgi:hypothetical protein
MDGHSRDGLRWVAAAVVVAALVLGLGFALRAAGLTAAANHVQLVSPTPLIAGLVGWAWTRRRAADTPDELPDGLGQLLRTIADAQRLAGEDLRARLPALGGIDMYLNGAQRPGWDFVAAFISVVASDDRRRRGLPERRVRPVWEEAAAASSSGGDAVRPTDKGADVVPTTDDWAAALPKVVSTWLLSDGLQQSVTRHEAFGTALIEMLGRLSEAVTSLAAERDTLRKELARWQGNDDGEEPDRRMQAQLEGMRTQLRDTQERLSEAERLQAAIARQLEKSERQRQLAELLKDEAVAEAEQARRMAGFERHEPSSVRPVTPIPLAGGDAGPELMGYADRQVAAEVLDRIDRVLRDEAVVLNQFGKYLADAGTPELGPGKKRKGSRSPKRRPANRTLRGPWWRAVLANPWTVAAGAPLITAPLLAIGNYALSHIGHSSPLLTGSVVCESGRPVVGVWIAASAGQKDSGFAHLGPPNPSGISYPIGSTGTYSYLLPHGGTYAVHVGCGGTAAHWASANYSPLLSSWTVHLLCDDPTAVSASGATLRGECTVAIL